MAPLEHEWRSQIKSGAFVINHCNIGRVDYNAMFGTRLNTKFDVFFNRFSVGDRPYKVITSSSPLERSITVACNTRSRGISSLHHCNNLGNRPDCHAFMANSDGPNPAHGCGSSLHIVTPALHPVHCVMDGNKDTSSTSLRLDHYPAQVRTR
jgi:hypothetical protein